VSVLRDLKFTLLLLATWLVASPAAASVDYVQDIKPLFAQHCYRCHGASQQKGDLRMDTAAFLRTGGDRGPAFIPAQSSESILLKVITGSHDDISRMPYKKPPLSDAQIKLIQAWVDQGAHAPAQEEPEKTVHWAFIPPVRADLPDVALTTWPRNPIDRFILARLEEEKPAIIPSPEADRITLIRRVTYDLTGLPPTPEALDDYLADTGPDAYSRLVDRLLASPRFGERMASLWLPLARYAEDQAHQVGDDTTMAYPNAHLYREWVIDAFNRDLPYDQFLRFQLAADKIEGGKQHLAALGFLGLGPKYYNRNRLEVQADEWEDRVDTVTRTVLGLTVACARCHDHNEAERPADAVRLPGRPCARRASVGDHHGDPEVVPVEQSVRDRPCAGVCGGPRNRNGWLGP